MKISQELRDAAAGQNDVAGAGGSLDAVAAGERADAQAGMATMSERFREGGGEIYVREGEPAQSIGVSQPTTSRS